MLLPIIMAGGSGTRLWPLSRELNPKQFLHLTHKSLSLLQETITRLHGANFGLPQLVCNEQHRYLVAEQMRELGMEQASILLEPEGRGTAPAIALAACKAIAQSQDPVLLVLAVDHVIADIPAFIDSLAVALPLAISGKLVAFGVTPSKPSTSLGYIEKGNAAGGGSYFVNRYIESTEAATIYDNQTSGDFYQNSGIYMFRASCYIEALEKYQPQIISACRAALAGGSEEGIFTRVNESLYAACPAHSIDHVMKAKTCNTIMLPLQAGWCDVGSWSGLWEASEKDAAGNVLRGDVLERDTRNTYVYADHRLVATLGLDNLVIVETRDALLVAHKNRMEEVRNLVDQLKIDVRHECFNNHEVYRPWGVYDSIDSGSRYQVKRITVKPGEKLSVQMHHHRAEHWIVVSGTAKVTNGDNTYLVAENQSTYIPIGQVHALENPGLIPLELIEVQSGSYLGEDDIVRFEDKYNRT